MQKYQGYFKSFASLGRSPACGNTAVPKLRAHVTEGILSAHAKFRGNWLKITR